MSAPLSTIAVTPTPETLSYPVIIGSTCIHEAVTGLIAQMRPSSVLFIIDRTLHATAHEILTPLTVDHPPVHLFSGGESSKTLPSLEILWELFSARRLDRKSLIISIGGGAQSDVTGLAAATFMRGVPIVQVPTTLLSQVDASIGGKTGINFSGVKNLIGVVYQPQAVVVDVSLLQSLPDREFRSGIAEVIKHGVLADHAYFAQVAASPLNKQDLNRLLAVVTRSVAIKASIVDADPFERGTRKLLNVGHTVGHAIESLSHKTSSPLLHGEAIAIGMVIEAQLSANSGLLDSSSVAVIRSACTIQGFDLVIPFATTAESILEVVAQDKKNVGDQIRWSLPTTIGTAQFDVVLPEALIRDTLTVALKSA
jgi:3-dehydroquinate synthase